MNIVLQYMYVIPETALKLKHDSGSQDAGPDNVMHITDGRVVILINFGQGVMGLLS